MSSSEGTQERQSLIRRRQVYWMLPALLLHTLAYGAIIVPKINIIMTLICNNYFAHRSMTEPGFTFVPAMLGNDVDSRCKQDANVQALVSKFTMGMQLLAGLFSAITAPKLGSLSDRYGRVRLFVVTNAGVLVGEIVTILARKYPGTVSVHWILFGSAIDGLCGSFITAMAISNAYASDCTHPSERGVVFAWFHGSLFIGIALGPLIAAEVVKRSGEILTIFYTALAVHAAIMVYIALCVPESVTKERQLAARKRREDISRDTHLSTSEARYSSWWANVLRTIARGGGLFTPLTILWPRGPRTTGALRRNLVLLASVDTVQFGVAMGAMTVVMLYTEFKFDWGTVETSYFVAAINITRVVVLLVIFPAITRLVRGKVDPQAPTRNTGSDWLDLSIIWISLVFDVLAYVGYSTINVPALFVVSGCITALGGMGSPTLQSSLTKHVPADRVGQMLGAMGLLHGLARVGGPTVFNLIYARTIATMPQAVFVCLAATFGMALLLSLFIRPHGKCFGFAA